MTNLRIIVGPYSYTARFEEQAAPVTCAQFARLLPYRQRIIHARWSGEACWVPLGEFKLEVPWENATRYPAPGEILFYPGGYSETEILFPYGSCAFGSKLGGLAGNQFITVTAGLEHLRDMGRKVLWEGAQDIVFEAME
ncbi:MAG: DUF3830 family protein [Ktedonobacterales bacterium]